jgi:hypothetical protein
MNQLEFALALLQDDDGEQWAAATPLEYAAQTLYRTHHRELSEAVKLANLAYVGIAEHRPYFLSPQVPRILSVHAL